MVTTLAPGFPAPSVLPGQGLPDAVNTFLSGDLRAAARELDTLLARRTFRGDERTRADFLLGWISLRLGHYQRASAHFYRLRKLEEHPLREMAAHLEARADLLRGRPRTAIAECGQYAADFPDGRYSDECQLIRADAHLALGERAAAVELYQGFLDLNPDDQRREGISLRIAKALEDAGELKAAARSYRALFLEHHLPTTGLAADAALQRIEAEGLDLPTLSDDQLYVRACSLRDSGELEASYQLFCDLDDRHPAAGPEATVQWLLAAAAAIEQWIEDDRVNVDPCLQALAVIARRLAAADQEDAARELVRRTVESSGVDPSDLLWFADAAREAGDVAYATELERGLFDERRLSIHRIPDVVRAVLESDGPAAALELAERASELTLHERLLEVAQEAARSLGDDEALARWVALEAEAEVAREALRPPESEENEGDSGPERVKPGALRRIRTP